MPSHRHASYYNTWGWYWGDGGGTGGSGACNGYQYTGGTSSPICQTSSVGGNGAHNNLQPYITVYMWKRTA